MRSLKVILALVFGSVVFVGLGSGCNQSTEIPLADVKSPPPLQAQDKSKVKRPPGASPSELPY